MRFWSFSHQEVDSIFPIDLLYLANGLRPKWLLVNIEPGLQEFFQITLLVSPVTNATGTDDADNVLYFQRSMMILMKWYFSVYF